MFKMITDSFRSIISGIGTSRDAAAAGSFSPSILNQYQIEAAYRGSGMMRKCIDVVAEDSVRAWRDWKTESADITLIEQEERRLGLRKAILQAEILRGLGGGAIIMGLPGKVNTPAPKVGKGGLAFIKVVSRYQLQIGECQDDPSLPGYDMPVDFELRTNKGQIKIHPSRVICFRAKPLPCLMTAHTWQDEFWGESRVQALYSAASHRDGAYASFAHLVHKARVLRIGIPDLGELSATDEGKARLTGRVQLIAEGESSLNATVYDAGDQDGNGGEKIDQFQVSWAGMDSIMTAFDRGLSAVADIPMTRLVGTAAEGMNSSGQSQQQDWHKKIDAHRELELRPCLQEIDMALIPSAVGSTPADLWFEFGALDVPDKKAEADRIKVMIDSANVINNMGVIPDAAFAQGVQSMLIDEGFLPGLEDALNAIPESERFAIEPDDPTNGITANEV